MKEPKVADLPNFGVLECELDKEEVDYLWKLVKKYAVGAKWDGNTCIDAGAMEDKQFHINDDEKIFQNNVLMPLSQHYFNAYGTPFKHKTSNYHQFVFSRFWGRLSEDGDYQSIHEHQGVFTFVVWLRIPYNGQKVRQIQPGFRPEAGDFCLVYPDTCGSLQKKSWVLSEQAEGKMLFFPSDMNHIVYPHYKSTETYRVSLAGDIVLNSIMPAGLINPVADTQAIMMHQGMYKPGAKE